MPHLCANCFTSTHSLTEHRSEVDPPAVFHPDCCPGGCDSPEDDHNLDATYVQVLLPGRRYGKSALHRQAAHGT